MHNDYSQMELYALFLLLPASKRAATVHDDAWDRGIKNSCRDTRWHTQRPQSKRRRQLNVVNARNERRQGIDNNETMEKK